MKYMLIYGESGRERCDTAIDIIPSDRRNYTVLLAAGADPKHPSEPWLNEKMFTYLINALVAKKYTDHGDGHLSREQQDVYLVKTTKNCWGTFEETIACIAYLRSKGLINIRLLSTSWHMPRILRIWKDVGPEFIVGWFEYYDKPSLKTRIGEFAKSCEARLFGFIYRKFGEESFDKFSRVKNAILNG